MVQLLGPEGTLGTDPVFSRYADGLDAEKLRGFYADMAAIRRFDQEATALQRQGQLALWVPLTGQEAAQIGSGRASQPQDYIFPTYREHGVALTRNVDLAELLRQFRGVSNGGWNPKDTNFHLYTLVLAAQTPHASFSSVPRSFSSLGRTGRGVRHGRSCTLEPASASCLHPALGLRRRRPPAEDRDRAVTALDDELIRLPEEDRARRDRRQRSGIR